MHYQEPHATLWDDIIIDTGSVMISGKGEYSATSGALVRLMIDETEVMIETLAKALNGAITDDWMRHADIMALILVDEENAAAEYADAYNGDAAYAGDKT